MTTEPKRFDCPACGVNSWLNPETLAVTHDEPTCEAWQEAQKRPTAVPATEPTNEEALVRAAVDGSVYFHCPECAQSVRMRPREQPIPVEHSDPPCEAWQKIEGKKDDVERFLIKAGVHILVPERN